MHSNRYLLNFIVQTTWRWPPIGAETCREKMHTKLCTNICCVRRFLYLLTSFDSYSIVACYTAVTQQWLFHWFHSSRFEQICHNMYNSNLGISLFAISCPCSRNNAFNIVMSNLTSPVQTIHSFFSSRLPLTFVDVWSQSIYQTLKTAFIVTAGFELGLSACRAITSCISLFHRNEK
jgi:hypothetical protein